MRADWTRLGHATGSDLGIRLTPQAETTARNRLWEPKVAGSSPAAPTITRPNNNIVFTGVSGTSPRALVSFRKGAPGQNALIRRRNPGLAFDGPGVPDGSNLYLARRHAQVADDLARQGDFDDRNVLAVGFDSERVENRAFPSAGLCCQ
jgi:hypothetical protein